VSPDRKEVRQVQNSGYPFQENRLWLETLDPVVGRLPSDRSLSAALTQVFDGANFEDCQAVEDALAVFHVEVAKQAYLLGFGHGQRFGESPSPN